MKRFLHLSTLVMLSVFLIGCTTDKSKDENSENIQESTWTRSKANLYFSNEQENIGYLAVLDRFCWKREEGDECNLTPSDPRDIAERPEGERTLFVNKGDIVSLHLNYLTEDLPKPDEVFITQYTLKDEKDIQVEVTLDEYNQPKITAPEEPGKYYYLVHFKWYEEAVGEAYYALYFRVRDDS